MQRKRLGSALRLMIRYVLGFITKFEFRSRPNLYPFGSAILLRNSFVPTCSEISARKCSR
jgi:hypothetical protein